MRNHAFAALSCLAAILACNGNGDKKQGASPTLTIISPQDGAGVAPGATFVLAAQAADQEDGDLSASITWSDDTGELASLEGATHSVSLSELGAHRLTASVADKDGNRVEADVTVNVSADLPSVWITEPEDGAHFPRGATVEFAGSAFDSDGTNLSGEIEWTDSAEAISPSPSKGAAVQAVLSEVGTHVITAKVTGKVGAGQAQIAIVVVDNEPPNLVVASPVDGAYAKVSTEEVSLSAQAGDVEDCGSSTTWCLTDDIQWTVTKPDASTATYTSGTASFTPDATGNYTIAASVTDAGTPVRTTTVTRTLHVGNNPPPVCTISAVGGGAAKTWAYTGESVSFQGSCTDDGGAVSLALLTWSEGNTSLGTGQRMTETAFTAGTHTIELCAPNEGDLTPGIDPAEGCTSLVLTVVENTAPTCAILSPAAEPPLAIVGGPGVNFDLTFTTADGQDPSTTGEPLEYQIDRGTTPEAYGDVTSNPMTVSVWAGAPSGLRTFTLTITDSAALSVTCSVTVNVE